MKSLKTVFLTKFLLIILFSGSVYAQDIVLGTDFVSRYVWRGFDLGNDNPAIQPNVALVAGGFTLGFWGSYSFSEEALDEIDIYASYAFALGEEGGSLSLGFTDYMNPSSGVPFSNFGNYDAEDDPADPDDGPGAHFVELNAGYSGPESFPISLSLNMFVHNVEDNPIYFQVGYNTAVNDVGLSFFAGGVFDSSAYYGTEGFDFINVGFTASKTIPITESFGLPIFGSVMLNPAADHMFYVVGIKL